MADNVKQLIEEQTEEMNRLFGVATEAMRSEVKQVSEGVEANKERLDNLQDVPDRLDRIEALLDTIGATLGGMKIERELVQIVTDLQRRVKNLETAGKN